MTKNFKKENSSCDDDEVLEIQFIFNENENIKIPVEILIRSSKYFENLMTLGFLETFTHVLKPKMFRYFDILLLQEYLLYATIPTSIKDLFQLHFVCDYFNFNLSYINPILEGYKVFSSCDIASIVTKPIILQTFHLKNQLFRFVDFYVLKAILRIMSSVLPSSLIEILKFDGLNCHETTVVNFVLKACDYYPAYSQLFFETIRFPFLSNHMLGFLFSHHFCPLSSKVEINKAFNFDFDRNSLKLRRGTVFSSSKILQPIYIARLIMLIPRIIDWECIFCLENPKNSKNSRDFHESADDCGTSLLLMETIEGYIFGAFCNESWQSTNEFTEVIDPSCFLFSLRNFLGDYTCCFFPKHKKSPCIRHQVSLPPCFGNNMGLSDLFFEWDFVHGYSNLGNVFIPGEIVLKQLYADIHNKLVSKKIQNLPLSFNEDNWTYSDIFITSNAENKFQIKRLEIWLRRSNLRNKRANICTGCLGPIFENTSLVEECSDIPSNLTVISSPLNNHNLNRIRTYNDADTSSINEPMIKEYTSDIEL
eukprot:TRINITY_DN3115_c2_g9_i1.p1 TRINITY_DN3115_c2_g9~~TRINITY_DN3115_c2_g9_i1.p1  ORF type:complete len:535 (-),score=105.43 TRINITY_DN3115_c2_g9_i1:595-2199(-)